MTRAITDPQVQASDPRISTFVAANAGSGKTSTLVKRVARLLLAGADPEAILCVTYTKAAAAEMQRRLFERLGQWAIMDDAPLNQALADIDEAGRDLSVARALFARALETPGGLKIQTLHAFCEKLLRRFPLEAGVSPGFKVLEDQAAADIAAQAREDVARLALSAPGGEVARAYAHFSIQLDWASFNAMFQTFNTNGRAIGTYVNRCEEHGGYGADVWRRCDFAKPTSRAAIEREALLRIRWGQWTRAANALLEGTPRTDKALGARMKTVTPASSFDDVWRIFSTRSGAPRARLATQAVDPAARQWLEEEQARHRRTREQLMAAAVAEDTVHALTLAIAYAGLYEGAKDARSALDFTDLISAAHRLLTEKADAAWVLYKLDGGVQHVLLDEGQDTAPGQWDILRAITDEFFSGRGAASAVRTLFAVADEKQSIFSFQGAVPERFMVEKQAFASLVQGAGQRFSPVQLMESWRSTPEILSFVDRLFGAPEALAGLRAAREGGVKAFPLRHIPRREPGGCVELWPLEMSEPATEDDVWAPVDIEPKESGGRKLARRVARSIRAMVARGDVVSGAGGGAARPCAFGDVLILVRRRNALFHEIIRALKREGVPVGGADRLKLAEHGVFEDLLALARFVLFPADDLTLACLLRGPFCDVDEPGIFDLAHNRSGSLWSVLVRRSAEREAWRGAVAFLNWAREEAQRSPPFDFYSRVLSRLDGEGRAARQRLLTRMGAEGEDALDAFLAEVLASETRGVRDLETLVARMSVSDVDVKREQDDRRRGGGEVRVMTVHGAKGLEAPIVILPDTTTRATDRGGPLLETADGGFLWAPRKAEDCPASETARERRSLSAEGESSRLLYVALTRARDRLIVCGVKSVDHLYDRSWYDFVRRAFDELPIRPFAMEGGGEGWRYGIDPERAEGAADAAPPEDGALPDWTRGLAAAERTGFQLAAPSSLDQAEPGPAPSPLGAVAGLGRFRRGALIHHLLQWLPDVSPAEREAKTAEILRRELDLTWAQQAEMAEAALGVLADPRFAAAFGPGSKAEVALAGTAASFPTGMAISGRMDRLVVDDDRVLAIDFKTNRPAPGRVEDVDPAYVLQMAAYAAVLAEVYPGRRIETALLWTDGPVLMPLPENMLAASLTALAVKA